MSRPLVLVMTDDPLAVAATDDRDVDVVLLQTGLVERPADYSRDDIDLALSTARDLIRDRHDLTDQQLTLLDQHATALQDARTKART